MTLKQHVRKHSQDNSIFAAFESKVFTKLQHPPMISFLRNEKSGYRRNEKFTPYLLSTSVIYLIIAAHIRLLKKVLLTNSTVTKQLKIMC